jgi:uncharacterized protein YcsI (UPF0317 family)
VFREGALDGEVEGVAELWRDDLGAFLIGCSFTFERALMAAGLPVRHTEEQVNVPMYRTSIDCRPAGATVRSGDVPVFWACGVTPQAAAAAARPELMITHAPGHMFVTDLRDDEQAIL